MWWFCWHCFIRILIMEWSWFYGDFIDHINSWAIHILDNLIHTMKQVLQKFIMCREIWSETMSPVSRKAKWKSGAIAQTISLKLLSVWIHQFLWSVEDTLLGDTRWGGLYGHQRTHEPAALFGHLSVTGHDCLMDSNVLTTFASLLVRPGALYAIVVCEGLLHGLMENYVMVCDEQGQAAG